MANLTPNRFRAFDANGEPLAGGKLYTYEAGTTTPKNSFTTQDESVANTNPVILDADGYADVWLGTGFYKLVLTDSADVTLWTIDDVVGAASNAFSSQVVSVSTNTNITSVYENNTVVATASLTLLLLGAAAAGDGFYFSVRNDSSGNVTLDPDGAETINGASTLVLSPDQSCIVVTNGTAWFTLGLGVQADADNNFSGDNTFTGDNSFAGKFSLTDAGELTISSGAITVTASNHTVDTESDAASDDLDTINGGVDGGILYLRPANDARTVVIKHGTGNIATFSGTDITLDSTDKLAVLIYDSQKSEWLCNLDTRDFPVVLASGTFSAASSIDITLDSAYQVHEIYIDDISVSTDGAIIFATLDSNTGVADYLWQTDGAGGATGVSAADASDSEIEIKDNVGIPTAQNWASIRLTVYNAADATKNTMVDFFISKGRTGTTSGVAVGFGRHLNAEADDILNLFPSAGTFSGKYKVKGIK